MSRDCPGLGKPKLGASTYYLVFLKTVLRKLCQEEGSCASQSFFPNKVTSNPYTYIIDTIFTSVNNGVHGISRGYAVHLPMMPKLREPAVELCHTFAAMKWLKGEITIAAPDLSNRTMGPE